MRSQLRSANAGAPDGQTRVVRVSLAQCCFVEIPKGEYGEQAALLEQLGRSGLPTPRFALTVGSSNFDCDVLDIVTFRLLAKNGAPKGCDAARSHWCSHEPYSRRKPIRARLLSCALSLNSAARIVCTLFLLSEQAFLELDVTSISIQDVSVGAKPSDEEMNRIATVASKIDARIMMAPTLNVLDLSSEQASPPASAPTKAAAPPAAATPEPATPECKLSPPTAHPSPDARAMDVARRSKRTRTPATAAAAAPAAPAVPKVKSSSKPEKSKGKDAAKAGGRVPPDDLLTRGASHLHCVVVEDQVIDKKKRLPQVHPDKALIAKAKDLEEKLMRTEEAAAREKAEFQARLAALEVAAKKQQAQALQVRPP
jgi:hypothetical protein